MTSPTASRHISFPARAEQPWLGIAMTLAAACLLLVVLSSFHHHPDLNDHPECGICTLAHQVGSVVASPVLQPVVLPILPLRYLCRVAALPAAEPSPILRSRAPPC